jgi:hypothetical protein
MVLGSEGRPVVAVEAKSRPVPDNYESVVREQAGMYTSETGTPWAVVIDPANIRVFRAGDGASPVMMLSTEEALRAAFPERRPPVIGEQLLLFVVPRWLHGLAGDREFIEKYPLLRDFANDCQNLTSITGNRWP